MVFAQKKKIFPVDKITQKGKADCVLILGARVRKDGNPGCMLKDRLDKGLEVYRCGVTDRILVSGDHGRKEYDEVNHMKDYLVRKGVDPSRVFMDHAGFCTYDSIYRAKEIFCVRKMIIVTQPYHMYRSLYTAEKLGVQAWGVCTENIHYKGHVFRLLREWAARIKYIFLMMRKPLPKYLGAKMPIQGNGVITDDKKTKNKRGYFV